MKLLARDSIRILHVDDDDDFAELSSRSLLRAGFKQPVVRCNDGLLALEYFSKLETRSAPHVILLDLHMPGMNGLEVLRWLRQNYSDKHVAIYLLTSSENPEHRKLAAADSVTEFLFKSHLADKLIEKLDWVIEMSNKLGLPDPVQEPDPIITPTKMGIRSFSHQEA